MVPTFKTIPYEATGFLPGLQHARVRLVRDHDALLGTSHALLAQPLPGTKEVLIARMRFTSGCHLQVTFVSAKVILPAGQPIMYGFLTFAALDRFLQKQLGCGLHGFQTAHAEIEEEFRRKDQALEASLRRYMDLPSNFTPRHA